MTRRVPREAARGGVAWRIYDAAITSGSPFFRFANYTDARSPSAPALWGLDSVKRHRSLELFQSVTRGWTSILREHPEQATNFDGFLNFMEAKYVTSPWSFAFDGWEKVGDAGGIAAWLVPGFQGGEYLVGKAAREPRIGDESIAPEIGLRPVECRPTAVVGPEGFEDLRELEGSLSDVNGQIERIPPRYDAMGFHRYDAMGFHVVSDRPALLVIANNYYPGWTATANGRRERIYRTNWSAGECW